jgi:hypothetical protein
VRSAWSCDEELDQSTCGVVGIVVGAYAEVPDAAHELEGPQIGANLAGTGCSVEQSGAHGHEAVEEVGVQRVEAGVVGLQHGSESVLGDQ